LRTSEEWHPPEEIYPLCSYAQAPCETPEWRTWELGKVGGEKDKESKYSKEYTRGTNTKE